MNENIPFSMMGCSPGLSGKHSSIDLYTSGLTPTGNIERITLYVSGESTVTTGLSLYILGLETTLQLACFVEGYYTDSDFPLNNGYGARLSCPLYMTGYGVVSPEPELWAHTSGSLSAYLYGSGSFPSYNIEHFIHGSTIYTDELTLMTRGVNGYNATGVNMYLQGMEPLSSGLPLIVRGY